MRGPEGTGMSKLSLALYVTVLSIFAILALVSLWFGIWLYAILATIFGIAFSYAGWFVLSRAWRPPPPSRRRPVRRRR